MLLGGVVSLKGPVGRLAGLVCCPERAWPLAATQWLLSLGLFPVNHGLSSVPRLSYGSLWISTLTVVFLKLAMPRESPCALSLTLVVWMPSVRWELEGSPVVSLELRACTSDCVCLDAPNQLVQRGMLLCETGISCSLIYESSQL